MDFRIQKSCQVSLPKEIAKTTEKQPQSSQSSRHFTHSLGRRASYVSTYPHEPEIFVERVHYVTADGKVGLPVPDGMGMLIKYSECERLEFLRDPGYQPAPAKMLRLGQLWNYLTMRISTKCIRIVHWAVVRFFVHFVQLIGFPKLHGGSHGSMEAAP